MTISTNELDWNDYPMTLRPKHIEQIMGMSQKKTYELLANSPFHVARAGRDIYISKLVFRNWFEGTDFDTIPTKVSSGS